MNFTQPGWPLAVALSLITSSASADEAAWQKSHDTGWKAYQDGRIEEAEKQLRIAAKEVKAFAPADPRVATTLARSGR